MPKSSTAGFILSVAFAAMPVSAQTSPDDPTEESGADEEYDGDYYVIDDPEDLWPDDVQDEDYGLDDEPDNDTSGDEPETEGVRDPPGLPLVGLAPVNQQSEPAAPLQMSLRSFGGTRVADAAAPWQAQIYYPNIARQWQARVAAGTEPWVLQHFCGGVLVAPNWVATAAHCIDDDMRKAGYRVRLGQERIDQPGGWSYRIDRVVQHPDYKPLKGGDIALIHIAYDQQQAAPPNSQVRPIALFRGNDAAPKEPVKAFGWGRTEQQGRASNAILLQVTLNILDRPTCDKARVALIDMRVVCAAAPGVKTCSNDSGGPLVNASRELVAIVSAGGRACADDGVPGVYTRIAAYLPWISTVTGGAVR